MATKKTEAPRKGTKWAAPDGAGVKTGTVWKVELVDGGRVYLSGEHIGGGFAAPQFISVPEKDFGKWTKP